MRAPKTHSTEKTEPATSPLLSKKGPSHPGSPLLQRIAQKAQVHSPPIQLVKTKEGVKYATSESEATTLLKEYTSRIDLEWEKLSQSTKNIAIELAQDHKRGGIDQGERIIFSVKRDIEAAKKKAEREQAVKDDYEALKSSFDGIAKSAIVIAYYAYIGGGNTNITLGGSHSSGDFYAAMREWDDGGHYAEENTISNFHSFAPQNKKAAGKGQVGDTLDTRETQGNLICKFKGVTLNVHVNIG